MSRISDGLALYKAFFLKRRPTRGKLDRTSLPAPLDYLDRHGLLPRRHLRGASRWISIRCPAHKHGDEQHPSMRVSVEDGHFKCHACGATGGDIVALHQLVTGMKFLDAVADLGGRFND